MDELTAVGATFVDALAERDFAGVERCLAPNVRLRSLKPPGPAEDNGSGAVVDALRSWFGTAEEFKVLDTVAERLADRVHVSYRFLLGDHPFNPGSGPQAIEQHLFCAVENGRIAAADMLCSGFRPA